MELFSVNLDISSKLLGFNSVLSLNPLRKSSILLDFTGYSVDSFRGSTRPTNAQWFYAEKGRCKALGLNLCASEPKVQSHINLGFTLTQLEPVQCFSWVWCFAIWCSTNFSPMLSCSIKRVSTWGHLCSLLRFSMNGLQRFIELFRPSLASVLV